MNERTRAMILLLMEKLIDWKHAASENDDISFYDVYADMLHALHTANDVLTADSVAIVCRSINNQQKENTYENN